MSRWFICQECDTYHVASNCDIYWWNNLILLYVIFRTCCNRYDAQFDTAGGGTWGRDIVGPMCVCARVQNFCRILLSTAAQFGFIVTFRVNRAKVHFHSVTDNLPFDVSWRPSTRHVDCVKNACRHLSCNLPIDFNLNNFFMVKHLMIVDDSYMRKDCKWALVIAVVFEKSTGRWKNTHGHKKNWEYEYRTNLWTKDTFNHELELGSNILTLYQLMNPPRLSSRHSVSCWISNFVGSQLYFIAEDRPRSRRQSSL